MSISSVNLPALVGTSLQHTGSFTTDANPAVTTTTTASVGANGTVMAVASTAQFSNGSDIITVPGAGLAGATSNIQVIGVDLQALNQLSLYNTSVQATVASGTTITRWERLDIAALPKHVRVTRQSNGDYYDWVAGMEPYSANSGSGLLTGVMLVQSNVIHFAPGLLAASETYTVLVEY